MIPKLSFIIFSLMTEFSEAFQPFRLPISPLNDSIALKYISLSVIVIKHPPGQYVEATLIRSML